MTQEEKSLLLKDLCARLYCGVICKVEFKDSEGWKTQNMSLEGVFIDECYFTTDTGSIYSKEFKPYLRPMSSMTKEERKELNNQGYAKIAGELYHYCALSSDNAFYNPERHPYVRMEYVIKLINWLNAHHFDYRGLIPMGIALEAPEGMYDIKS